MGLTLFADWDLPHVVIIAYQIENMSSYFEFMTLSDYIKH